MSQQAPRRQAPPQNQLTKHEQDPLSTLQGSFREPHLVNEKLATAASACHLVAPATAIGTLPEGCAVALSIVQVDTREMGQGGEVYSTGGDKYGISKSVLDRVAAAAGISWDPQLSGRVDDGSDPYYCHFRAVGHVRHFDGTEQVLTAEKEMDLRQGSPQLEALWQRYEASRKKWEKGGRKGYEPKEPTAQIRELRLHILGHAESKAKNRAIRSLGLKSGYTREDLAKPFVVAKLMWTGQTSDPELRRIFAEKTADRMLGGSRALFGVPGVPLTAPGRQLRPPPPVGAIGADLDDLPADTPPRGMAPVPPPHQLPAEPPRGEEPPPPSEPGSHDSDDEQGAGAAPAQRPAGERVKMPGKKGGFVDEADDDDLSWWENKLATDLQAEPNSRFADTNRKQLAAIRAERDARAKAAAADQY